jgi:hypothetical protein
VVILAIDNKLIEEARKIGGHDTKKTAVTAALLRYIEHKQQFNLLSLFGKIDYDPKYHYKNQRKGMD